MNPALLAILSPLAAAVLIVLLRRKAPAVALLGALEAVLASWFILAGVSAGQGYRASFEWLPGLDLGIAVDPLAAVLCATVAAVGFLVLVYAVGYMAGESAIDSTTESATDSATDRARFYAGMSLFLAAMQALVLAGDWLLFLAAWELIALASYLLIGHRHQREEARAAATRAFLTTRAADLGLYLGIFLLVQERGSTAIVQTLAMDEPTASAAGLLLLLAAAGKAAQIPFQGWLAAAMAGPTPVSALLHSATLVAAGVVLMLRAFPLLPEGVLLVTATLGGLTALFAGLTALAERDLKRLLAASTSSQLGLMLLALGAGSLPAALFHLVTHAAMKSTLFLSVGIFQHQRGATELGWLRGVGRQRPFAYAGFTVAGLALAGVPPLAGFWSKDAVLAASFASKAPWLLVPLAVAGSLLTAAYVARAMRLLWRGEPSGATDEWSSGGPASKGIWMVSGLAGLALAAALLGVLAGPLERLLAAELPHQPRVVALGVMIAAIGLTAGWLLPAQRLLGGLEPLARSGFRIAGGMSAIILPRIRRLAGATRRLDERLHVLIVRAAPGALAAGDRVSRVDGILHRFVEATAGGSLAVARSVRVADLTGIEAFITALARGIRRLGRTARKLQSGLIHSELALTLISVAGLVVLLLLEGLRSSG